MAQAAGRVNSSARPVDRSYLLGEFAVRESIKAICMVLLIFSVLFGCMTYIDPQKVDDTILAVRYGCFIVCVLSAAWLIWYALQRDLVPDFLSAKYGRFYDRNGLCFIVGLEEIDGYARLLVRFQNRYERSCQVTIALREAPRFWSRRVCPVLRFDFECPAAAYGLAHGPADIPTGALRRRLRFDIGADVYFPKGKGRTLRVKQGIHVSLNSNFRNFFASFWQIMGIFALKLVTFSKAQAEFHMPTREFPPNIDESVHVLTEWQLSDSELAMQSEELWSAR
jgi:hypothetical protein